jgi:peptidoglycan/LPS O-acetylase OafA/YrhL
LRFYFLPDLVLRGRPVGGRIACPAPALPSPPTSRPRSVSVPAGSALPSPHGPVYRSLEFWRGLICLLIVARHTAYLEIQNLSTLNWEDSPLAMLTCTPVLLSWLRVPLFFVMSGYCLAAFCDKLRRSPNPAWVFARRRARRIFIPYWASLLLMVPLALVLHAMGEGWWTRHPGITTDPRGLSWTAWFGNLTLIEHWRTHLAVGPLQALDATPNLLWGHLWTLSFEILLYLLCAILLVIQPRRVLMGMIALGGFAVVPLLLRGRLVVPLEWLEFSLGALLYCQLNYFRRPVARATTVLYGAAMLAAIVAELALGADQRIARTIAVSTGFVLLLVGLKRWDDAMMQARLLQPFLWCGRMSYSIYLIHMPISMTVAQYVPVNDAVGAWPLLLVGMPLGVGLSIAAGALFYQLVEAPLGAKPCLKPTPPDTVPR